MTTKPDPLPLGSPYAIGLAVVAALRADTALSGVKVLDNPVRASDLADGERIVFFEDQNDKPRDQSQLPQQRTYSFSIGVISRAQNARTAAHADYRAARRVLRQACMPAITAAGVRIDGRGLIEGEVRYRLENIDVGGGLVLGLFTIDYRDPG